MSLRPFAIHVSDDTLDDLRHRLINTRWPDEVTGAGWEYGTSEVYLKQLLGYWRDQFDWRAQEAALNWFSHFRTEVDSFGLHFIQERGAGTDTLPLLLLHGYPDSFVRFLKLVPMLTDPGAHGGDPEDAFDVVVPSLPGFGFSDRPHVKGMDSARIAELLGELMIEQLGYERFGVHGGDWGAAVGEALALKYPDAVVGLHLTNVPFAHLSDQPAGLTRAERAFLADRARWVQGEGASGLIQSSRPESLAFGLNDSPAGLAGWFIEKFRDWSDCDGDVEQRFTKDELLINLMVYWVTETAGSATRLHYEEMHRVRPGESAGRPDTPTAMAMFPRDISRPPREWVDRFFNVVRWTDMPRGGHFTAMEEPELLADDLSGFFHALKVPA